MVEMLWEPGLQKFKTVFFDKSNTLGLFNTVPFCYLYNGFPMSLVNYWSVTPLGGGACPFAASLVVVESNQGFLAFGSKIVGPMGVFDSFPY